MRQAGLALAALLVAVSAAAQPAPPKIAPPKVAPPKVTQTPVAAAAPKAVPKPKSDDRVAVLGVLDKRLGTTAEFTLKPGERFTFGRLSGVMRGCEKTQPFERKQSAAFVQIVDTPRVTLRGEEAKPRLAYSGWLFAESPSLNPMQHPVYDVWLKSCTMSFPDGPKAVSAVAASKPSVKPRRAKPATPPSDPSPVPGSPVVAPTPAT